jgi:hypothetical protein
MGGNRRRAPDEKEVEKCPARGITRSPRRPFDNSTEDRRQAVNVFEMTIRASYLYCCYVVQEDDLANTI